MQTNPPAPDQCCSSFYGNVACKCYIRVLYGPEIQSIGDTNIEADRGRGGGGGLVEGRGTGKIVYLRLKLFGIDLLGWFNLKIIDKKYEISICFVQ